MNRKILSFYLRQALGIPDVPGLTTALQLILPNPGWTIVQIGAHAGDTPNDPLFCRLGPHRGPETKPGKLLLVEPLADHFKQLCLNYKGTPGVVFEQAAVAEHSGSTTIFTVPPNLTPSEGEYYWLDQLSSLKSERMESLWEKQMGTNECAKVQQFYLENRIEEKVPCLSFSDLLEKHQIERIDLLQIDVEGYEFEILRQWNPKSLPVRFLHYESDLLFEKENLLRGWLHDHGFSTVTIGADTFAWCNDDREFVNRWRPGRRRAYRSLARLLGSRGGHSRSL